MLPRIGHLTPLVSPEAVVEVELTGPPSNRGEGMSAWDSLQHPCGLWTQGGSRPSHTGIMHLPPRRRQRTFVVDSAAGGLDHGHVIAERAGIERRMEHTEIRRQSREQDRFHTSRTQQGIETHGRGAVVLEEGRIAVDRPVGSLANDHRMAGDLQGRMKIGPRRMLDAMIGPERLLTEGKRRATEWLLTGVTGGK